MYKLLIVDDEDWIRERLKSTIDWNAMNIEVAGEARDGEEALEVTERLSPDIVITDIRMPCIDGLEYIRDLRVRDNHAKVIIISGYSDFEYARKAIKLGAFDYILKPVEDESLIGIVKHCLEEIESERQKELLFRQAREQMIESKPLLKKEFFMNLVNGFFLSREEIIDELAFLDIRYPNASQVCFIIALDESETRDEDKDWGKHLIRFVMCNLVQDFSSKLGRSETFVSPTGEVICLIFSDTDEKVLARQVLSISNGIRKMMWKIMDHSVTIGIGRVYGSLIEIEQSYRDAREALQYRAYLGNDRIYDIRNIELQHRPQCCSPIELEILLNHIRIGSKERAFEALDNIVEGISRGNRQPSPIELKLLYMDIVNSVFKTALDVNASFNDFSEFSFRFFEQLGRLQTVEEIRLWLMETISKIIDVLKKYQNSRKRKVIEKALEYIDSHYTEDITLNSISEKFYLNASYFCKVFKEEMGESFTRYLINLRVQKAKELLADPRLRIYEIAGKVGYDDVQYFTKIFKSITDVTPVQYREKIK